MSDAVCIFKASELENWHNWPEVLRLTDFGVTFMCRSKSIYQVC